MRGLYVNYTSTLLAAGVQKVMQFVTVSSYSTYGSWGLKNSTDQRPTEAPKYLGFMDFLKQHECARLLFVCGRLWCACLLCVCVQSVSDPRLHWLPQQLFVEWGVFT